MDLSLDSPEKPLNEIPRELTGLTDQQDDKRWREITGH